MQDLGTLGGTLSGGNAINDSGQVTGEAYIVGNGRSHAFLWDGASMHDLSVGTLGGVYSTGMAINAAGQVTGLAYINDVDTRAFLWDGTTTLDLGTLGGTSSRGFAINDSGQVTGFATRPATRSSTLSCGTARRCRISAQARSAAAIAGELPSMPRGRTLAQLRRPTLRSITRSCGMAPRCRISIC